MILIIVATHYDGYMKILEYSCKKNNIKFVIIKPYLKKKFQYIDKFYYINEYIKKLDDNEVIITMDAYDTFICGNYNEILNKYNSSNKKFLVGSHTYCDRYMMQLIFNIIFQNNLNNKDLLNSGMFISKVIYAKEVLNICLKMNTTDDQIALIKTFKLRPDLIQLDNERLLFANLQQCTFIHPMKIFLDKNGFIFDENKKRIKNINNNNYPCFIHGPFNMKLCDLIYKIYPEINECYDTTNYKYFKKIFTNKLFIKYTLTIITIIILIYLFIKYYKNIKKMYKNITK
jgi:hypothetical protein